MTVIVPTQSAADVARHYDIDPRAFRRWMRRNQNVRLLGTIDSPAMHQTIGRFRLCGSMTDAEVLRAWAADTKNVHLDNESRGRGLRRKQS